MVTSSASNRRPGRPSRISRDQIVSTTLEILEQSGVADFSIGKLAKQLGVAPMALYRYFPSRDALLDAAADEAFMQIKLPEPSGRWQDFVTSWMRTLLTHFERYPLALEVIAWDEHLSPGWLHVWLPILEVMANEEPDDERLAFIASWFSYASIGFIQAYVTGPKRIGSFPEGHLATFDPAAQELLRRVHQHYTSPRYAEILEFEFQKIIASLEDLLSPNPEG